MVGILLEFMLPRENSIDLASESGVSLEGQTDESLNGGRGVAESEFLTHDEC